MTLLKVTSLLTGFFRFHFLQLLFEHAGNLLMFQIQIYLLQRVFLNVIQLEFRPVGNLKHGGGGFKSGLYTLLSRGQYR